MIIKFDTDNFVVNLATEESYDMQQQDSEPIAVQFNSEDFICTFDAADEFACHFGGGGGGSDYDGRYRVTPSQETQTLYTADKTLAHNVVVEPIPSNYGKITWDGHTLTVS